MSHEKIANVFDDWAAGGHGVGMEKNHGDVVEQVIDKLNIKAGFQILDLGCGVGWATRVLAQKGAGVQAIGVDASPGMIKLAEELSPLTIRARYELGHFEKLDFKDGKFNMLFSMEALYYTPDLDQALTEFLRVLQSGGHAEIVMDNYEGRASTAGWSAGVGLDMHHLSPAAWQAAFEKAGFTNVRTERVVDRRGAGVEAEFKSSSTYPDWDTYREYCEAGSLWVHGEKA
ncbi:MAG: SAM-dependent methyltransferase [Candidatus Paceibacteria bacterium]|jgi:SAM-dependent methyltransferase